MQSLLPVLSIVGFVTTMFSLSMAVPLGFAWVGDETTTAAHALAMAITALSGLALWLSTRRYRRELQPRDGFLLVTLVWLILPAFGTLPLMFHMPGLSFTDAYFETASGLTTTGATVMTGLDALPTSINVWRCLLMFLGAMGIIVLAVAILPLLGVGGSQIFKAETPGPMKDVKLTPRIAETARGLWGVYFGLCAACFFAYGAAGMGWADAFMHMCTTMSLGGLSSHDASFAYFDSPLIESVAIVFMLLAGVNFALYFMAWKRRSAAALWRSEELRAYAMVIGVGIAAMTFILTAQGTYPSASESFRRAAFQVVSVATTTGYATADYAQWPSLLPYTLLLMGCFATAAGSTGGGIKMIRALLLLRVARRELVRLIHPRAVHPVRAGGSIVEHDVLFSILAFMMIYGMTILLMTLAMLASGLDPVTAFTAVVACVNNIGPGLGQVGPAGNFQGLSDLQTWICTAAMVLGRLELLSILVLFTPQFWRK